MPASGSSVELASAPGVRSSNHSSVPDLRYAGSLDVDCVQSRDVALPAATRPLPSTPIEPLACTFYGPVKDAREGVGVPMDPRVALMTPQAERGEPRFFGAWCGPTVRTVSAIAFPSSHPTRPVGSQHPFRLGLSPCLGGPIHPMTGWPSLPPTSSTPWALASFTAS